MRTGLLLNMQLVSDQSASDVYAEALEQAALADAIGFDSIWVGESHFNDAEVSLQPQTFINAVAAVTKGVRIGTASKVIGLDNPIRVAEDFAVLDLASNGRVVLGATVGDAAEAYRRYHVNYEDRVERFKEYIDIITRSWTSDGFKYAGKFYKFPSFAEPLADGSPFEREPYRPPAAAQWLRAGQPIQYLPVTPKPVQLPHPPIWIDSVLSEVIHFAAANGFTFLPTFLESTETMKARVAEYREAIAIAGRGITEVEWPVIRVCYVAETSEQARSDTDGPLQALFSLHAKTGRLAAAEGNAVPSDALGYERLASEHAIIGSPEQVIAGIKELYRDIGTNHFIAYVALPGLRHDKVIASMRLFNAEVWSVLQA